MAAAGELPLPSQAGKDRPFMDFETNPHSLETKGTQPQPSAAPQENPNPSVAPQTQPAPITAAEQFAMLTQRPTPAVEPSAASQQARSAYRPLRRRVHISGNISNRGSTAVNALGTPLGRYEKIVKDSVGSRWYAFVDQKRDLVTIGTLRLRFYVDRSGQVKNLKITENSSNETFANVCLQSVIEAHLPPIPEGHRQHFAARGAGSGWIQLHNFSKLNDRCGDNYRNPGNREYCVWILLEGRPFHVAVAGMLDCFGDNDDFARPRFAAQQGHAAFDRERNGTFDPR